MPEAWDDPVAPGLRAAISLIPDFDTLTAETLPSLRNAVKGAPIDTNGDAHVSVEIVTASGSDGHQIECIFHRPRIVVDAAPVLLNIHGGGYVMGDAAREAPAMAALAAEVGCAVLSVDYRLAPEFPYPAALDDCTAALQWLTANASRLGVDPDRIAVRGVSAGGGLATALMLRCREISRSLRLLMLVYPMLDNRPVPAERSGQHVWTRRANAFAWEAYLGAETGARSPEAVPGLARDLTGFPPTFLAVGDIDLFLMENLDLAVRLGRAEVPLEMHVYRGGYHGFNLVPGSDVSAAFARDCKAALVRAFWVIDPLAPQAG